MSDSRLLIHARSRGGPVIADLDGWERLASTKGKWKDGFSAEELARLWLEGLGAGSVEDALPPAFADLRITEAVAEGQTTFDRYAGGVRNHDVLAYGRVPAGPIVIGVEGKVNESLDARIEAKYAAARQRQAKGLNTNLHSQLTVARCNPGAPGG